MFAIAPILIPVTPPVSAILILDTRLRFPRWIGRALRDAGHTAFEATNGANAIEQLYQLQTPLDLVIVNPDAPGVVDLMLALQSMQGPPNVIALSEPKNDLLNSMSRTLTVKNKPAQLNEAAKAEWLSKIETKFHTAPIRCT